MFNFCNVDDNVLQITNQLVAIKRRSGRVHNTSPALKISIDELDNFLKQVLSLSDFKFFLQNI
jgi:hypothetical protein